MNLESQNQKSLSILKTNMNITEIHFPDEKELKKAFYNYNIVTNKSCIYISQNTMYYAFILFQVKTIPQLNQCFCIPEHI